MSEKTAITNRLKLWEELMKTNPTSPDFISKLDKLDQLTIFDSTDLYLSKFIMDAIIKELKIVRDSYV